MTKPVEAFWIGRSVVLQLVAVGIVKYMKVTLISGLHLHANLHTDSIF